MSDLTYRGVPLQGDPITLTVEFTAEEWAEFEKRAEPKIEARIQAEMTACPYVACECGYHYADED